jgi:hypothetical protein
MESVWRAIRAPTTTLKLLFSALYLIVYFFLAFGNIGAEGKGPIMFLAPLLSWPVLFIAVGVLGRVDNQSKIFFVGIMLIHYVTTLYVFYRFTDRFSFLHPRIVEAWNREPGLQIMTVVWYLVGQILIWTVFLLNRSGMNVAQRYEN